MKRSDQSGHGPVRIIVLQRLVIVAPLVAEDAAKLLEMRRIGNQAVPVIMPDLVTEMTERRAVQLAHLMAAAFALRVVGFGEIDGDDAVGMAGHHRRGGRRGIGEKLKGQAAGTFRLGLERQPKLKQRVEQPMLGDFEGAPFVEVLGQRQVGDHPIVPAGRAIGVGPRCRNEPVAHAVGRVCAVPVAFPIDERSPDISLRIARALVGL